MTINKFNLRNKLVVISGGAGLLGNKHCEAVIEADGIPVILDINKDLIKKSISELTKKYNKKVLGYSADITKEKDIIKINEKLKTLGGINILINNAAKDPKVKNDNTEKNWSRFENYPEEIWDEELAVGLKGTFICSKIFGSFMAEKGKGVILNISSDLGIIAPDQRIYQKDGLPENLQPVKPVTYSVIKHGIIGITKYLATYWAAKGIRVNALCPGGIYNNQPDDFVKKLTNLIPLKRMANIDEYKAAVLFLISDASSYMTGSTLIIDGGRSAW